MRRFTAGVLVAIGIATEVALGRGALGGLPAGARVALALATLVLLPGWALVTAGLRAPGGGVHSASWALGLGVAWNAALLLVTLALGVAFTRVLPWAPVASAGLWLLVLVFSRRRSRAEHEAPQLSSGAAVLVLVAAALAALHVARLGTPLTIYSDSPDHIGTIRRMLEGGRLFPVDAFFRDAGAAGADPRKGLWHGVVALIAGLSHVDPIETWRDLSAILAPWFVLTAAAFGFLLRGNAGAVIAAWALLLTYGGGLGTQSLREAVYATKLADQLALATAVAVLADLARPARSTRIAVLVLGFAAVTTHVFAGLQFALVFGALGVGLLIRDRGLSAPARRLLGTGLGLALVCAPYLAWRASHAHSAVNVIHTEPQGLLAIGSHLHVVSIGVLWEWLGLLWVVVPLAWIPLWRRGRTNPAALYLLTSSVAVGLVLFDPLLVGWLEPRLGYLLMRMIWLVPLAGVLAWLVPELWSRMREGPPAARPRAALALAVILALAIPMLSAAVETLLRPGLMRAAEAAESPLRWRALMRWMDAHLPPGQVVLSDPATSYAVPMMSREYVVTLLDQHSSPSDSLALRRILDARDALDPYGSWATTREIVRRYGAEWVLLNGTFTDSPGLDYWGPSPEWYRAVHARLASAPAAFEPVAESQGLTLYRVHAAALDTLSGAPAPRTFVVPFVANRFPIAQRIEEGRPVLHALRLWPGLIAPGDTLWAEADWRALEPQAPGSYRVTVRFDRALPWGLAPPAWVAKPLRKVIERTRGERYRFRDDHMPTGDRYPVDAWRPDEVVRDSFRVIVPGDVADGRYQVQIKMLREPHYVNLRLSDYFLDRDYYTGVTAGVLEVRRSRLHVPLTPEEAAAEGGH